MRLVIADEPAMIALGETIAETLTPGDWLAIDGPLGAGKTVLSKGILRGLGYVGEVASPSYALVHHYDPPDVRIAVSHADLYRLRNSDELDELGLAEEQDDRVTLVEWAERGRAGYGFATQCLQIIPQEDGTRIVMIEDRR